MQVLGAVSRCGAATSVCVDRAAGAALVHFEQAAAAGGAVRELRRVAAQLSAAEPDHPRLCVDYASRECQVPTARLYRRYRYECMWSVSMLVLITALFAGSVLRAAREARRICGAGRCRARARRPARALPSRRQA